MLLSEQYKAEQARLHAAGNYGTASLAYGEIVSQLVDETGAKTLLDYGCGSMRNLAKVLDCDVLYQGYDPAVPAFSADPDPADMVVCIDVLEHIEPDCLESVLDHLKAKTRGHAFFTIHTGPAVKKLSDGRNAHLIQQPASWWLPQIMARWDLLQFTRNTFGFEVVLHGA
jgi:Methyltransferase domain